MRQFDMPGRSQVFADRGMVATSHPLASSTALDILREGGSAVDAALAASFVLSVVEPHMSGIGGDCFAIIFDPSKGGIHAINGSGRSAANAHIEWYQDNGFTSIPERSAHSVTTPGALKAFDEIHQKFGILPWARLFRDAVKIADEGFSLSPRVAYDWAKNVTALQKDDGANKHLLHNGHAPKSGERVQFKALAETLRIISNNGIEAFYHSEIASEIAEIVQLRGGFLSENDIQGVKADWVTPVSTNYSSHRVLEIPPNGQGIVTLIMMNLMELLDIRSFAHDSCERYHHEIEIARVAYAVRDVMLSDPDYMTMTVDDLISMEFAKTLVDQIKPQERNNDIILPHLPSSDTVYLTIADQNGQMVSLIYSIYSDFGCGIVTPKSGIVLQSRGACFNTIKGHPNAIGPSKRPLHTIIPAFAFKGDKPAFSFGVMGGAYQPIGQAHVFSNLVDYGLDPQAALDHPRIFWGEDGVLEVENGISHSVIAGLQARGHQIRISPKPVGGGQIIQLDPRGYYCAGSDSRKDGLAIGY